MEGDYVLVQAIQGPLVRRVVREDARLVFITHPDEYEKRARGQDAMPPVGFPRAFVYQCSPATCKQIKDGTFIWEGAVPY